MLKLRRRGSMAPCEEENSSVRRTKQLKKHVFSIVRFFFFIPLPMSQVDCLFFNLTIEFSFIISILYDEVSNMDTPWVKKDVFLVKMTSFEIY